jgi:hypothetical protein
VIINAVSECAFDPIGDALRPVMFAIRLAKIQLGWFELSKRISPAGPHFVRSIPWSLLKRIPLMNTVRSAHRGPSGFASINLNLPGPPFHRSTRTIQRFSSSYAFSTMLDRPAFPRVKRWTPEKQLESSLQKDLIFGDGSRDVVRRITTVLPRSGFYDFSCFAFADDNAPDADLLATSPILVVGRTAPPANVWPHLLHRHMPTLTRFTALD